MPQALPLILGIISAGVGVTQTVKSFTGGGSDSQKLQAAQQAQAEKDAKLTAERDNAARGQSLRRAAPDAQAQTGGSLTDAPLADLISHIAGQPGDIQSALKLVSSSDPNGGGFSTGSLASPASGFLASGGAGGQSQLSQFGPQHMHPDLQGVIASLQGGDVS